MHSPIQIWDGELFPAASPPTTNSSSTCRSFLLVHNARTTTAGTLRSTLCTGRTVTGPSDPESSIASEDSDLTVGLPQNTFLNVLGWAIPVVFYLIATPIIVHGLGAA